MHHTRSTNTTGPTISAAQRLMTSAATLFAQKGYAATSVREIVAAAGVTKPVLYYYFSNKAELYLAIMEEALTRLEILLESCRRDSRSVLQRLQYLADHLIAMCLTDMDVARLIHATRYNPPQGVPHFDTQIFQIRLWDIVLELVQEGMAEGVLRAGEATDMVWAILGALNITLEAEICHPHKSPGREGLGRIIKTIFTGLAATRVHDE